MDKLELYKSFYDRENLRRETLNNSVSVPVGILTGLIAAIVFLITSFNYKSNLILIINNISNHYFIPPQNGRLQLKRIPLRA